MVGGFPQTASDVARTNQMTERGCDFIALSQKDCTELEADQERRTHFPGVNVKGSSGSIK
jgi:hypothetical protein